VTGVQTCALPILGSLSLELIEPVGGPSTWREFLDTRGEGVHHIAFHVPDTEAEAKLAVALELLQDVKTA